MSLRSTARAFPTMMRIGFAEAVAYRAELLVWVLATTMPLVMLALWTAVARDAPIGRFGQSELTAYFLVTFIVRQMTGSWAAWSLNMDVRQGALAGRLLRPVSPLVHYAIEGLAAMPLRLVVALPVAIVLLATVGARQVTHDPLVWCVAVVALVGAWLITVLVNLVIGCLALFIESSAKVMDLYLAGFFVMSGYLVPIDLFPPRVRELGDWLPFRYQMGFPVELLTRAYDGRIAAALEMAARQWTIVLALVAITVVVWRRGLARFAAYGG